jgi:hypothetical protein
MNKSQEISLALMNVMPLVLVGAVTVFLLVEYLAAFIQYGRGGEHGRS